MSDSDFDFDNDIRPSQPKLTLRDSDSIWDSPAPPDKVISPPRPPLPTKKKSFSRREAFSAILGSQFGRQWPTSTASSREFLPHLPQLPRDVPLAPKIVKARQITFLDFPDTVRKQIYELAIYDHDRSAVFLPRALPRKVVPGVDDVDVECTACVSELAHYSYRLWTTARDTAYSAMPCQIQPTEAGDGHAHGTWLDGHDSIVDAFCPVELADELKHLDDEEILRIIGDELEDHNENEGTDRVPDSDMCVDLKEESAIEELLDSADVLEYADTIDGSQDDDSDDDSLKDAFNFLNTSVPGEETLEACEADICGIPDCNNSCNDPTHLGEYKNDPDRNVFNWGDNIDIDDEDHFDPTEQIGMLYEPHEPAILLVSKEIRAQCLPIYYSCNAFSWRFDWTDYQRSCVRFKSWAKSIDGDNVRLLTKLTLQSRHAVEEGVEFSADIDLLEEHPFFETNAYTNGLMGADFDIAHTINRELASYLWLMVQYERSRPVLSAGHLCELASIFVQGMHRDAGGSMDENALALRMELSLLF